jgi:ComF family protein
VQYGDAVAALVRATKYERMPSLTSVWRRAWEAVHREEPARQDAAGLIVPVPLHPGRVRERGFDVVAEWSTHLSRSAGVPLVLGLARTRQTPQQVGQSARRRIANVAGAFSPGPEWQAVAGRQILLVDDVVTTGATVREAAAVLRSLGAAGVGVWCFAFEPLE